MSSQLCRTQYKLLRDDVVLGESKGWCITSLSLNHLKSSVSLPCEFLPLRVSFSLINSEQIQEWQISPYAQFASFLTLLYEISCYYSICVPPFITIPRSTRNKKPLFSCRGCNFMLSEPIVLQKLHLFMSCIVYWWCGSGRRLSGHNYTAAQTSKTAFPFTWISIFRKPKVRKGWNKHVYPLQRQTLKLYPHTQLYSNIFMQIRWAGHVLSASALPGYQLCLFGLGFWFGAQIMLAES